MIIVQDSLVKIQFYVKLSGLIETISKREITPDVEKYLNTIVDIFDIAITDLNAKEQVS